MGLGLARIPPLRGPAPNCGAKRKPGHSGRDDRVGHPLEEEFTVDSCQFTVSEKRNPRTVLADVLQGA